MVFDKLRKALFAEDRELELDEAVPFFEEQRADTLERLEGRIEEFRDTFRDGLEELELLLEQLRDYSDPEDRSVVEDVLENIYSKKKKLVDELELPQEPDELEERLDRFIEQFQTLTFKEREVLKQAGEQPDRAFSKLRELKQWTEDFAGFLDDEFLSFTRYERVQDLFAAVERLREEKRELLERADEVDLDAVRESIDEAEKKLQEFKQSDEWDKVDELERRREELEAELTAVKKNIQQPFSRMERGLKKILYRIENGDIDLAAPYRKVLEELKQGEMADDAETFTALEKLEKILEERDVLSGRYRKTFRNAIDTLRDVPGLEEERDDLQRRIEGLEERLEGFDLEARQEELEARIGSLEEKLEERKGEIRELREKARRKEKAVEERIEELEAVLNEEFLDDIRISD